MMYDLFRCESVTLRQFIFVINSHFGSASSYKDHIQFVVFSQKKKNFNHGEPPIHTIGHTYIIKERC